MRYYRKYVLFTHKKCADGRKSKVIFKSYHFLPSRKNKKLREAKKSRWCHNASDFLCVLSVKWETTNQITYTDQPAAVLAGCVTEREGRAEVPVPPAGDIEMR